MRLKDTYSPEEIEKIRQKAVSEQTQKTVREMAASQKNDGSSKSLLQAIEEGDQEAQRNILDKAKAGKNIKLM